MKQKIKKWIQNVDGLVWMKLWAAIILGTYSYWVFSDLEIVFQSFFFVPKIFLPWIYFYGTDFYALKKTTALIVPLLMNIVLWAPCYRGYIFLRAILYVERITAIIWLFFWFFSIRFSGLNNPENNNVEIIILFIVCASCNEIAIYNLKKEEYKEKFSANFKTEPKMITLIVRTIVIFYLTIFPLLMLETMIQKKFLLNYARIETINFISIPEKNKPEQKIPYERIESPEFSRDNKMLAGKLKQDKDENNKFFIMDSASMQTIKILEVNNTIDKKNTNNSYAFTPDSKGLVVSNEEHKIKFTILDIATGEVDTRFSDPKNLLEKSPDVVDRVFSIRFNPSGKYFVINIQVKHRDFRLEVWDYEKGTLVHVEKIKGDFRRSTWLSEKNLGIFYMDDKKIQYKEILLNDDTALLVDNEKNTTRMLARDLIGNDFTIKHLALFGKNNIQIWNLEEEKEVFSLERPKNSEIKEVKIHPNNKYLIVVENLRNKMVKITYWNMDTGQKQKTFFVRSSLYWYGYVQLTDNGNKLLLIGDKVVIVLLKESFKNPQYDIRDFKLLILTTIIVAVIIYYDSKKKIVKIC